MGQTNEWWTPGVIGGVFWFMASCEACIKELRDANPTANIEVIDGAVVWAGKYRLVLVTHHELH